MLKQNSAVVDRSVCLVIIEIVLCMYLRNELDFWKVHGILNTSGLLRSK